MDAKPLRQPHRAVRIHDENMPLHAAIGPTGKTLHQRTKSTSALAATHGKKVLGETNANIMTAHKDDSEIGKASPAKMQIAQDAESAMPGPLQRPAVRPLGVKSSSGQNILAGAKSQAPEVQMPKNLAAKKSTKVLRDVVVQPEANAEDTNIAVLQQVTIDAGPHSILAPQPSTNALAVQHQEVHQTESVPLRDGPAAPPVQPATTNFNQHHAAPVPAIAPHHSYSHVHQPAPIAVPQPINDIPVVNPSMISPVEPYDVEYEYDDADQAYTTAQSLTLRAEITEMTTIMNPYPTNATKAEIAEAKAWVDVNRTPDDVDDEAWDVSMVAEYGEQIFEYMRELETRMSPNSRYMEQQQEIDWSMRGVLMDWVVQVHGRFNLLPETLFLAVNYIDRFLSCKVVSMLKLQLVGATAIFVAAKWEEVNCPTVAEIIYMVDNGYSADELLKAERFMLSMLQYELGWPGPMSFLRRISKADDYDLETRTLAKYFLEVTIMDDRFVGCKPSFLAAAAHCMARLMLKKGEWTKAHVYYSNYTFRQLHRLLVAIFECCHEAQNHHAAVYDKYTDRRYKRAATFVAREIGNGFQLPFAYYSSSLGPQNTGTSWAGQ